jgi:hypothetical protein
MKASAAIAILLLSLPLFAQDATTTTQTAATCCTLQFENETVVLSGGELQYVQIELTWKQSDGETKRSETIRVTDGEAGTVADNYLTGTGAGGTPSGYLRAIGETPSGETGSLSKRWKRRRLQWLKDNAKLSNNAITIE